MKLLISIILLVSNSAFAQVAALDVALEAQSLNAEYSTASKTGVIRVVGCELCTNKIYPFDSSIVVKKQGKNIPLPYFMKDYWNAKYPTIFLENESLRVIRVSY